MDRAALEQSLAESEEQIAGGELRVAQQSAVIADLERSGQPADHAKYLLAGLKLLLAAHRDNRTRLLKELSGESEC
jgi:hypothetical protein